MKYLVCLLILIGCSQPQSSTSEAPASQLGDLRHPFTISEEAQPGFDKGLLLLHSFEYDDARTAFEEALAQDSTELMVYWGLAMTHYKALWGLQNLEAGRAIMARVGDTESQRLDRFDDDMEKDFWQGIELLFGEGELRERNERYVAHMKSVYERRPDNQEVAAFYALGLMWADYNNRENLSLSSQVAASIIAENPTHPGALHYMIHANDDPQYALEAIEAANQYAQVAPDAAHALHMPSHIYVALGMWKEVVSSNADSYQASINRMERKGLSGNSRGYHSMAWLHYGYLQLGQYDKAATLLEEMIGYHQDGTADKSYVIMMQNQQRIESGVWPDSLEFQEVDLNALRIGMEGKAKVHFLKSLLAYDRQESTAIGAQIESLSQHLEVAKLQVTEAGVALCSAGPTRYAPDEESIKRTQVVLYQMEALKAQVEDDTEQTEMWLKKAVALEQEVGYDPGPPFIALPSYEQYGEWLLTQGRHEEALGLFDQSLEQRTHRVKALRGKKRALEALGRDQEAKAVDQLLNDLEVVVEPFLMTFSPRLIDPSTGLRVTDGTA